MSCILTSDIVFYSSLAAELRKRRGFTLQGECKSGWKAVPGQQLPALQHQNSGMDPCVLQGALTNESSSPKHQNTL